MHVTNTHDQMIENVPLDDFPALLRRRVSYVHSLHFIGEEWLSGVLGGAKAPRETICVQVGTWLEEIALHPHWSAVDGSLDSPKLVMGPTPTGGISIEMSHLTSGLYLDYLNSGELHVQWSKDDDWIDHEFADVDSSAIELKAIVDGFLANRSPSEMPAVAGGSPPKLL